MWWQLTVFSKPILQRSLCLRVIGHSRWSDLHLATCVFSHLLEPWREQPDGHRHLTLAIMSNRCLDGRCLDNVACVSSFYCWIRLLGEHEQSPTGSQLISAQSKRESYTTALVYTWAHQPWPLRCWGSMIIFQVQDRNFQRPRKESLTF